jgi:hypothetical protein
MTYREGLQALWRTEHRQFIRQPSPYVMLTELSRLLVVKCGRMKDTFLQERIEICYLFNVML